MRGVLFGDPPSGRARASDLAAGVNRANAIVFDDGDRHRARCRKIS
jgi:hypothetical protein